MMKKSRTGCPERYETPDTKTFNLSQREVVCASGPVLTNNVPGGFTWEEDWED